MSGLNRHIAWLAGCRNAPGQSHRATGDEFHQGNCGGYTETFSCPNGLPIDKGVPSDSKAWRERVERARRDIADHNSEYRVREIVSGVVPEILDVFLKATRVVV